MTLRSPTSCGGLFLSTTFALNANYKFLSEPEAGWAVALLAASLLCSALYFTAESAYSTSRSFLQFYLLTSRLEYKGLVAFADSWADARARSNAQSSSAACPSRRSLTAWQRTFYTAFDSWARFLNDFQNVGEFKIRHNKKTAEASIR